MDKDIEVKLEDYTMKYAYFILLYFEISLGNMSSRHYFIINIFLKFLPNVCKLCKTSGLVKKREEKHGNPNRED